MDNLIREFEAAFIRLKDAHYEYLFTADCDLIKKLRSSLSDLAIISERFITHHSNNDSQN